MTKPLFFKVTSDQLLLCVFLSLLWGITDSSTTTGYTTVITSSGEISKIPSTTPPATKPPPGDTDVFQAIAQNETSITLQWNKVDDIPNYILSSNGREIPVIASEGQKQVNHTISGLTSGTKYDFTLFTVFENVSSSGVNLTAATAPRDTDVFQAIAQNEASITLQWNKVGDILNYRLSFNGTEIDVTASAGHEQVDHTISGLTSGNEYDFTLFTMFENVSSSGVNLTASTAPRDTDMFKAIAQNETSITLQWNKVGDILNYRLSFNGTEIDVTASAGHKQVSHTIPGLTSGNKYDFTLFTMFENVSSSGVNLTAVTAPRDTDVFEAIAQNETSITLQWNKVDDIPNYILSSNGREIPVIASEGQEQVNHTISGLKSGTKYDFTLSTVFENVSSSGVNLTAATAPGDTDVFQAIAQNETSITLQWNKVGDILNYRLSFNGTEIDVTASAGHKQVSHTIPGLTSGNKYDFTLFTMFENVSSSGVNLTAVTAPRDTDVFEAIAQSETSITLQWNKVDDIPNYILSSNGREIPVIASEGQKQVTHTISGLKSGTKYDFTLFTVFENVSSSGVNLTAVTAPGDTDVFQAIAQNETSITLQWNKVGDILNYRLSFNGTEIDVTASAGHKKVNHTIPGLTSGNKYDFTLFTMFENVSSSGVNLTAVTAPLNTDVFQAIAQKETGITLQWNKVGDILNYRLLFNGTEIDVTASAGHEQVSHTIPGLTSGNKYDFTLFTMFENVSSSGVNLTAATAPGDTDVFQAVAQNETSITLQWNKVDDIPNYILSSNGREIPVIASEGQEQVNHTISGLKSGTKYDFTLFTVFENVSSSGVNLTAATVPPTETSVSGVIAGSVFGVLLFIVLVCLVVFILLKRPDIIRRKKVCSKLPDKKTISVAKFPDHFYQLSGDDNWGFSQEYESLIPVGTEQKRKEAILPDNKARNRFNNVLPYDWCRVKLTTLDPNATSDYINASYMPGYNSNREYIATQGPLPSTVNDFWRMIWEQTVKGIVMVTNCTEGGRAKCEQYWPAESDPCPYGELTVTMNSEQQEPNWTLRDFRVKHSKTSEERTVRHFHFTAWPDHGVPQGTEVLIQFRGLVRQHIQREGAGAPTVVHCSAGVGRTGTIIALDVLLQQLEKERAVGINAFVHKMRLSRPHMVQTESQYIFLHQCIMDCLQPKEKMEENIYENAEMIYVNATALQEFHKNE